MNNLTHILFRPLSNMGILKTFLVSLILLAGILSVFVNPVNIYSGDFMLIAWKPGQELLKTGFVNPNYPYPLWTVVIMLPLVLWTSKTGMILMYICNMAMLAASLALLISIFKWEVTPILLVLTVSLSGFYLPVLTSVGIGQLTIFSFLILVLTTRFFLARSWTWLGIALGLSLIKPHIMLLLTGLLLLWAMWQHRWNVLLGFGGVAALLVLISLPFISSPGQIIGGGIESHLGTYIMRAATIWALLMNLGLKWYVPLFLSLGMLAWVGWNWLPFLRGEEISSERVVFLFSAAIMINLLIIPYSWAYNLILLLLPFGYCFSRVLTFKGRRQHAWLTMLFFVMHPLTVGIFIIFKGYIKTQAYQIVPVLVLLPIMIILESYRTKILNAKQPSISR